MSDVTILPGLYKIMVTEDGVDTWARYYDNAVEAVSEYAKFKDYGLADWERIVTLESPDGSKTVKRFTRIGVVQ